MASREMFKKLKTAKVSGGGNNIRQGRGRAIVSVVKFPTLDAGDTFIAELYVKASENYPGALDNATQSKPEYANPPGSTMTFLQQPGVAKFKSAPGNIRAFVEAVEGSPVEDDDYEQVLMAMVNEDPKAGAVNPARGMEVDYETYQRKIKSGDNAGKPITLIKWKPVALTDEQITANCELLDGKGASQVA